MRQRRRQEEFTLPDNETPRGAEGNRHVTSITFVIG